MSGRFLCVFLSLCSLSASAARHVGFEADAFARLVTVSPVGNLTFSPFSFEIDCALVAESLETIPKANVSEMMGVVIDFEGTYAPILETLSCRTNGLLFTAARGFCVKDVKSALPSHRIHLSRTYGAEVMRSLPSKGAESWFRATMEGQMENFEIPISSVGADRYSFYDLVSVKAAWKEPFPMANTRMRPFRLAGGTNEVQLSFMSDVRPADTWETTEYILIRLPLRGDALFYALLPRDGYDLSPVRADVTSIEINHLLSVVKSITEKGVSHGFCDISLPRISLFSRVDMAEAFRYFRIPTKGLVHVTGDAAAKELVQYVRFSLAEHAEGESALIEKSAEDAVPAAGNVKTLVFDRPFLFFVYHEGTETIPIAGQFMGKD